jgi:hypothetical protein
MKQGINKKIGVSYSQFSTNFYQGQASKVQDVNSTGMVVNMAQG